VLQPAAGLCVIERGTGATSALKTLQANEHVIFIIAVIPIMIRIVADQLLSPLVKQPGTMSMV
jgi:hypothetical protein